MMTFQALLRTMPSMNSMNSGRPQLVSSFQVQQFIFTGKHYQCEWAFWSNHPNYLLWFCRIYFYRRHRETLSKPEWRRFQARSKGFSALAFKGSEPVLDHYFCLGTPGQFWRWPLYALLGKNMERYVGLSVSLCHFTSATLVQKDQKLLWLPVADGSSHVLCRFHRTLHHYPHQLPSRLFGGWYGPYCHKLWLKLFAESTDERGYFCPDAAYSALAAQPVDQEIPYRPN